MLKKKVLKLGIRWMKFGKRICVIIFSLNGIVEGEKLHVYLIKHFKKDFCSKKYVYWSFFQVDGNMAIAWSGSLNFTVERSGKSLIGSAASGEGLVNVYRGTGKVLLAPVIK